MEIRSLSGTNPDAIFEAFDRAFADYEVQNNKKQLQAMLKRRGFNPGLSFAAFDQNEIVAFTFNGVGSFNGMQTAYDTGTGTIKEFRGMGLATNIFEYSIPYLKEAGIRQYLLEVLQHNNKAVSVYSKLGFEVTREFNYFIQQNSGIKNAVKDTDFPYLVRPIDGSDYDIVSAFWDFPPSWQNSFESVQRATGSFISLGVFDGENLAGYCIFEPSSGDITQLAVDKNYRRKGIASLLLHEMVKRNKYDSVKVLNTDINCDSITAFLKSKNIDIKGRQFEMIRKL